VSITAPAAPTAASHSDPDRSAPLGEGASLGNLNRVAGFEPESERHFASDIDRYPSLFIEGHAAVTHRHLIDCTDRVTIGAFSTVAGDEAGRC
jgi:hypothetical protein